MHVLTGCIAYLKKNSVCFSAVLMEKYTVQEVPCPIKTNESLSWMSVNLEEPGVAQLVKCWLPKLTVQFSNPSRSGIFSQHKLGPITHSLYYHFHSSNYF